MDIQGGRDATDPDRKANVRWSTNGFGNQVGQLSLFGLDGRPGSSDYATDVEYRRCFGV